MIEQDKPLVIIGGGIAGAAAALRAAQYCIKTYWFLGSNQSARRSRVQWVRNIDNMIGVHPKITQKTLLKALSKELPSEVLQKIEEAQLQISTRDIVQNVKERLAESLEEYVTLLPEDVTSLEKRENGFRVGYGSSSLEADYIVLATGVMDKQPMLPHSDKLSGEVYDSIKPILQYANHEDILYCIRCEGHLTKGFPTAVIGHSESAAYVACMLYERYGNQICILTHGEKPSWKAELNDLLALYKIAVYEAKIVEVLGKPGLLEGFRLQNQEVAKVRYAFCMLGLFKVYNQLAQAVGVKLEEREVPPEEKHILIDAKGETNVPNFFAIGDMVRRTDEPVMKQIYTSQEYAVRAVDAIDGRLRLAYRQKVFGKVI